METLPGDVPPDGLVDFCRRWKIREFAFFGSILQADFRPDSDVDVMVTFEDGAGWSLLEVIAAEHELAKLFGRPVDLVERSMVERSENWIRRDQILKTATTIYTARAGG